jgi:hypothetical protein
MSVRIYEVNMHSNERHPFFNFMSFISLYFPLADIVIVHIFYINACLPFIHPYSGAGCADLPLALLCDHERRRRERELLLDTEIRGTPAAPVETSDTRAVIQAGTARCNMTHAQPRAITLHIIDRGCLARRMLK